MTADIPHYDLIVIGAGSGGVRAARVAAELGAKVAIVEASALGGTCVNAGCVPKKLFTYASAYAGDFADAEGYGWSVPPRTFTWERLIVNKDAAIARLNGFYDRVLKESGVTLLRGTGRLLDANTVAVGEYAFTADSILIATGAMPDRPNFAGQEHAITSDEAFHLPALPQRAVVVGGGYIGVEFASIFHELGCVTTLVHRSPRLLRDFDAETTEFLTEQLRIRGLDLRLGSHVSRLEVTGEKLCVHYEHGGVDNEVDLVLVATGRIPNTQHLNLQAAGVKVAPNGAIVVDGQHRSNVPNIYAVGDVTDRLQLTPVAIAEGALVARRLFGSGGSDIDYDKVATAVFSRPNLGTVGLTEAQARAQYDAIKIYVSNFSPLKHMLSGNRERMFMKLIVDAASDRVLGAHMVGAEAGEIIQGLAVTLQVNATKAQVDATLAIHPTSAEEFVTMRTLTRT